MSGFERILARVGGDALRDYCSSAIEDELKNLKSKMESCLAAVEQALEVQSAIVKLDVPLDDSAAAFKSIHKEFKRFNADLEAFVAEQHKIQEESPEAKSGDGNGSSDRQATPSEQVSKLLGKIQNRITRKRTDAWIDKNFKDVEAISELVKQYGEDVGANKAQRHEMVLVLDHLISAILLSPLATFDVLMQLETTLGSLLDVHKEIDEYIRSSSALLVSKRLALSASDANQSTSNVLSLEQEPLAKKQRVDASAAFNIKSERLAEASIVDSTTADSPSEVYVSDLPWGAKEADVQSYFSIAGHIESVRMPTMDDGSTVGVAVVTFSSFEGATLALRMNGYPFNGKTIRVAISRAT